MAAVAGEANCDPGNATVDADHSERKDEKKAARRLFGPGRGGEVVKMAKPFEFIQEVRQEVSKVTWPTRKEVMITTAMVLVMVVVASLFFLVVDQAISWLVGQILGLARR